MDIFYFRKHIKKFKNLWKYESHKKLNVCELTSPDCRCLESERPFQMKTSPS